MDLESPLNGDIFRPPTLHPISELHISSSLAFSKLWFFFFAEAEVPLRNFFLMPKAPEHAGRSPSSQMAPIDFGWRVVNMCYRPAAYDGPLQLGWSSPHLGRVASAFAMVCRLLLETNQSVQDLRMRCSRLTYLGLHSLELSFDICRKLQDLGIWNGLRAG